MLFQRQLFKSLLVQTKACQDIFILRQTSTFSKRCCPQQQQQSARYVATTTAQQMRPPKGQRVKRPPVVTIMGHVDHGKTTLLDHLRNSQIVKQEFGGITQHIGAFVVPFKQKNNKTELVTFLDTPGHAAFASMRQRGANVTDIVVLVVACEDGVLDQTAESIRYAQTSQVPIIVAINKIDKYESNARELEKNVELVRKQLIVHNVISEADGGEVQLIKISALKGQGVEDLKEAILALAETLELETELDCPVRGSVIESQVDQHRGKLCTILVQQGTLRKGNILVAGSYNYAKVRALFDERGQLRQECGAGLPIQVTGWRGDDELPSAGDPVIELETEQEARQFVHKNRQSKVLEKAAEDAKVAAERAEDFYRLYKEKLIEKRESGRRFGRIFFNERGVRPKESQDVDGDKIRKINLVLKCDVDGSLEALLELLDTYDRDQRQPVKLDVMHYGVGAINDNDLVLASSFSNSLIYGFNVKLANQKILLKAKQAGVDVKLFNVIYHLVDDLKGRLAERMPELEQEVELGQANVLQEFVVKEGKRRRHVAGCRCGRGLLRRDALYKLLRNNQLIARDLQVHALKHLKEEVKEIEKGRECGISFLDADEVEAENNPATAVSVAGAPDAAAATTTKLDATSLEFKQGDLLVAYEKRKYKPKLQWDLKGF